MVGTHGWVTVIDGWVWVVGGSLIGAHTLALTSKDATQTKDS